MNIFDDPIKHHAVLVQAHSILASAESENSDKHFAQVKAHLASLVAKTGSENKAKAILASVPMFQSQVIAASLRETALFSPYKNKAKKYLHNQLINNGYKAKRIGGQTHYTLKEGDKLHHVTVNHADNTGQPEVNYKVHKQNGLGAHVLHSQDFGAEHSANNVLHHISKGKGLLPNPGKNVQGDPYYRGDHQKIHDNLQRQGFQQKQVKSGLFGQHRWTQHTKTENGVTHTVSIPHHKGGHVEYTRTSVKNPYKTATRDFHQRRTSSEINANINNHINRRRQRVAQEPNSEYKPRTMLKPEVKQGDLQNSAPRNNSNVSQPKPTQNIPPANPQDNSNVVQLKPKVQPQLKPTKPQMDSNHAQLAKHLQNSGYSPQYNSDGPAHTTFTKHVPLNGNTHKVHLNRDNSTTYQKTGPKGNEEHHFPAGTDYGKVYQHSAQRGGA